MPSIHVLSVWDEPSILKTRHVSLPLLLLALLTSIDLKQWVVRILRPDIPGVVATDQYFPRDVASIGTDN